MTYYLSLEEVVAFHQMVMERTGAKAAAIRDAGLLESAITRPQSAAHYEGADLIRQTLLLAVGISKHKHLSMATNEQPLLPAMPFSN